MSFLTSIARGPSCRRLAFWVTLALALHTAGDTSVLADPPPTSANRFLFIVDVSAAMKPLDDGLRQSMFDLVYSGVRGHMTNGDTFGVWLVRDANDTSFPMEVWKQKFAVESAAKAALHVKDSGLKGKARLDIALEDAGRVIRAVRDLTVIVVSDGSTPLRGTPFDDSINASFAQLAPEMRRAKATLNTTLVAQDGQLVAWAVNSPEFLIEFPQVPPRAKSAKPEIAQTAPPAAEPPKKSQPAPPPPPPVASAPIIITRDTVAHDRMVTKALASTQLANEPPITNGVEKVVASTGVVVKAAAPPAASPTATANTNVPPPAEDATAAPLSTHSPAARADTTNGATTSASRAEADQSTAPASEPRTAAVPPAETTSWRGNVLWAGIGACLGSFALIGMALRRERRHGPSLISRAAALERMRQ